MKCWRRRPPVTNQYVVKPPTCGFVRFVGQTIPIERVTLDAGQINFHLASLAWAHHFTQPVEYSIVDLTGELVYKGIFDCPGLVLVGDPIMIHLSITYRRSVTWLASEFA